MAPGAAPTPLAVLAVPGLAASTVILPALFAGSVSVGRRMVRDYSLEDPIVAVKERFVAVASERLTLATVRMVPEAMRADGIDQLKQTFGAGIVLDFQTTDWSLSASAGLTYRARARAVRLDDAKTIWQASCSGGPQPLAAWDDLKRDDAAALKAGLAEAAATCAQKLVSDFLAEWKE